MKSLLVCALLLVACGGEDGGEGTGNLEGDGGSGNTATIDACEILTENDATTLFETPAELDSDTLITDPAFIDECSWSYMTDDGLGNQTIVLTMWEGEDYHAPRAEAEPFDIGDEGTLYESSRTGIDIDWLQDGNAIILSYFTVGDGVPDPLDKSSEVQALALEISGLL